MLGGCAGRATVEHAPPDDGGDAAVDAGTQLPHCAPYTACGGDLVGTWTLVSFCFDMPVQHTGCETLQYTANDSQGTIEFSDAGTFTQDSSAKYRLLMVVPAGCVDASCAMIQAGYEASIASSGTGTVVCSASDGGCVCDASAETQQTVSGQYTVNGSGLTLNLDPITVSGINSYCVSNDQLTLHEPGLGSSVYSRN